MDHAIDSYLDCWNSHDVDAVVDRFTTDCRYEDVGLAIVNEGHEQLEAFLTTFFHAYPDIAFTKRSEVSDAGAVAWEWPMEGTHENMSHSGIEPRGQRVSDRGVSLTRFDDGLTSSNSDFWNVATLAAQLQATL